MSALVRLIVAAAAVLALAAGSASAEERMWIGFHDDPVLRYGGNRQAELDKVRGANATIVRTLVEWRSVAPKRPKSATNSFDSAYRFADLDEFVRNTQQRGMEVLMTIWGTPKWANGGKGPAYLPTKMADFQNFARAVATRYNGKRAGYPFVRFYGIWNESNLGNFLAPQFDKKGKIVSPAAYAKLAAAGYAGIKAGQPEGTGRDRRDLVQRQGQAEAGLDRLDHAGHVREAGRAGEQEAQVRRLGAASVPGAGQSGAGTEGALSERRLQHDEAVREGPGQVVRPQEHPGLDHGVRERDEAGRAEGRHGGAAGRLRAAGDRVREEGPADPDVHLVRLPRLGGQPLAERRLSHDGRAKPAAAKWAAAAKGVDKLNRKVSVKGGTANPLVNVNYRDMCTNNIPGRARRRHLARRPGQYQHFRRRRPDLDAARLRLHDLGPPHGARRREGPHLPSRDRREHGRDTGQAEDITIVGT